MTSDLPSVLADLFSGVPRGDRPCGVDPSSPAEVLRRACASNGKRAKSHAEVGGEIEAALAKFRK